VVDGLSVALPGRCEFCYSRSVTWTKQQRLKLTRRLRSRRRQAGNTSTPKEQLTDAAVDLAVHASILLKGL
jgi:hypothetical protein